MSKWTPFCLSLPITNCGTLVGWAIALYPSYVQNRWRNTMPSRSSALNISSWSSIISNQIFSPRVPRPHSSFVSSISFNRHWPSRNPAVGRQRLNVRPFRCSKVISKCYSPVMHRVRRRRVLPPRLPRRKWLAECPKHWPIRNRSNAWNPPDGSLRVHRLKLTPHPQPPPPPPCLNHLSNNHTRPCPIVTSLIVSGHRCVNGMSSVCEQKSRRRYSKRIRNVTKWRVSLNSAVSPNFIWSSMI